MLVKRLSDCVEIEAGDHTRLRELLHPARDPIHCGYSLAHAHLKVGKSSLPHRLASAEVYYILSGSGRMEVDGCTREIHPGDAVYIPPGARQRVLSLGPDPLEFLCMVDPAWRAEDEEIIE